MNTKSWANVINNDDDDEIIPSGGSNSLTKRDFLCSWHHKNSLWAKFPSNGICTQCCGNETKSYFIDLTLVEFVAPLMEHGATKTTKGGFVK